MTEKSNSCSHPVWTEDSTGQEKCRVCDKILRQGISTTPLRHPCAGTCSGYKQGYELGRKEALEENRERWEAALSQLDCVEMERDLTTTETWIRSTAVAALKGK